MPPATSVAARTEVRTRGAIDPAERDHAVATIGAVLTRYGIPGDGVRLRLSGSACAGGPALVQVNLRVCGAPVRVQVAGRSAVEAIATGAARLARQVRRLTATGEPWPWPDPERRTLGIPGAGPIVRVKRYQLQVGAACQAISAMNAMDFDVHLFTDAETGEDAVVYRAGPTGIRLARQCAMRPPTLPVQLSLTVNARRVPTLTAVDAGYRLGDGWLPFLFFTNKLSGRGNVVYRRYDGGLGVIAPDETGVPAERGKGRKRIAVYAGPNPIPRRQ
jgi:hypothetical protein